MKQRLLMLSVLVGVMLVINRQTYIGAFLVAVGVIGAWGIGLRAIIRHRSSPAYVPTSDTGADDSGDPADGGVNEILPGTGGMSYGQAMAWERDQRFGYDDD